MSQENVEIVKRVPGAFAAGGIEALVPLFAPDAVIYPFPEWVEQSLYRGHDGLRAIFAVWTANLDDFKLELHEIREVGDMVWALVDLGARRYCSVEPPREPLGIVYSHLRGGHFRLALNFLERREALEAVGLRE